MNISEIIYRGFAPGKLEINYQAKKPEVLYRGFAVNKDLYQKSAAVLGQFMVYRGVRINQTEKEQVTQTGTLQYA